MSEPVHIVGNFPPPVNGQTLATQRLAALLAAVRPVRRLDTSVGAAEHVQADVRFSLAKVRHYVGLRQRLRHALAAAPDAPVLWAAVSPVPLGHLRDVLTILPAFPPAQPVFAVVHWGDFDRVFRHPLTAPTARRLVRRLRGVVFLTPSLAERCARWIPEAQRHAIPNTLDDAVLCTDAEVAAKRAARGPGRPLRLLYLSNMIAAKGYADVLDAVRRLHARGVPVRADFAGRWTADADRIAFAQAVAAAGLETVVTHHGALTDRARIKALHLAADAFLLPTTYPTEAQPLAILEALNAGTPVITTRHAGIPDMVRDGTEALFVPPHDPEAIAGAAVRLADAATWASLSDHARRRFAGQFSPAAVRRRWEALLATVAAPASGPPHV